MNTRRRNRARGLTLVELLLTIALIAILAKMSLGALSRARKQAKEQTLNIEFWQFANDMRERLTSYYDSQSDYPAWTASELHQRGVFTDKDMEYLRFDKVVFVPFSSSDPDDKYVITEKSGRAGFQKKSITHPQDFPY
ncbi:MAG TPA: type II secretion system protein [Verrucomicrobiae bacterium]